MVAILIHNTKIDYKKKFKVHYRKIACENNKANFQEVKVSLSDQVLRKVFEIFILK